MPEERLYKLYRPSDKGKARKSLSDDKKIDRMAALLSDPAAAFRLKSQKQNISRKTREGFLRLADQFSSKQAQSVIDDTQGGPKMQMKGFGN